ncbi:MAG: DegV family protein [Firmicutes bacterium]|nr:DegV family protein [Bacillota bacterium]
MSQVKIITDSTADLPSELVEKFDVTVVPLTTTIDGVNYRDGVDLTPTQFYEKLAACKELPQTSQPAPQTLRDAYQKRLDMGQEVVAIHLSSGLSSTVAAADLVRDGYPADTPLRVIDSRAASMGEGMLVIKALELAAAGKSLDEIVAGVENYRKGLLSIFVVDTLTYLLKGGRVNKAQAVMGSLLNIKPVLQVYDDGKIYPLEKARGRKAALKRLVSLMEEQGRDLKGQPIGISHAVCLEDALWLKDTLIQQFSVGEVVIGEIGAVIGTHVGPGTLALFFHGEQIGNH